MEFMGKTIKAATGIKTDGLDPDTARKLHLIKTAASPPPAPGDAAKRKELAELGAKMEGIYGKGKACKDPKKPKTCKDIGQLSDIMAESRNYDELLAAWQGWHKVAVELRPLYSRFVELANEGAREIGYKDLGELWRSGYDMSPAEFEQETERLWTQVKPLYDQLHCHVRAKLVEKYGKDKVPEAGLIPAHLLGNMWAQEWGNIYPLIEPYPGTASIDVTKALKVRPSTTRSRWSSSASPSSPRSASTRCRRPSGSARCSCSPRTARSCATRAPGTSTSTTTCASRCASRSTRRT
jgi:peptidyl-dipeptidase A